MSWVLIVLLKVTNAFTGLFILRSWGQLTCHLKSHRWDTRFAYLGGRGARSIVIIGQRQHRTYSVDYVEKVINYRNDAQTKEVVLI